MVRETLFVKKLFTLPARGLVKRFALCRTPGMPFAPSSHTAPQFPFIASRTTHVRASTHLTTTQLPETHIFRPHPPHPSAHAITGLDHVAAVLDRVLGPAGLRLRLVAPPPQSLRPPGARVEAVGAGAPRAAVHPRAPPELHAAAARRHLLLLVDVHSGGMPAPPPRRVCTSRGSPAGRALHRITPQSSDALE